jgi:hypothetical protein
LRAFVVSNEGELKKSKMRLKLGGLVLGIAILIWLPIEDSNEVGVLVLSGLICAWAGIWLLQETDQTKLRTIFKYTIIGGGAGLLMGMVAILLMAIKTGIHGHGTPDYTPEQILEIISRTPIFVIGGALLGVGGGLLRIAKLDTIQEDE